MDVDDFILWSQWKLVKKNRDEALRTLVRFLLLQSTDAQNTPSLLTLQLTYNDFNAEFQKINTAVIARISARWGWKVFNE